MAKQRPWAGRMMAVLMPMMSALHRHQRPAGIAGVERGIGLHDVVDQPAGPRPQRATQGADDARRDRTLKAEGIADGDHKLADADGAGIAELGMDEVVRMQPQDGEIAVGIVADEIGRERSSVGESGLYRGRAMHHVAVGEHEAVGRKDHARAGAERYLAHRGRIALAALPDLQMDDRRCHAIDRCRDGLGIGIEQLGVALPAVDLLARRRRRPIGDRSESV